MMDSSSRPDRLRVRRGRCSELVGLGIFQAAAALEVDPKAKISPE